MSENEFEWGDGSEFPLYLTNACCEATHEYLGELFRDRGIPHQLIDGDFYPLTKQEEVYIGEDWVKATEDGYGAMTGYSALYQGKKYLMPEFNLYFDGDDEPTEEEMQTFGERLADEYRARVAAFDGHVFYTPKDEHNFHSVKVLIPFEYAMKKASNFSEWKVHLEESLLKTDLTVKTALTPRL